MKLVVGLGNPGRRYAATRHNVGFRVVERFAREQGIRLGAERFDGRFGSGPVRGPGGATLEVAVLEPLTYMNRSGAPVRAALDELSVEDPAADLLVVLDDVDLPLGRLRLRPSGSGGGHRGLDDVIASLGHGDFPRLRFGIARPSEALDTADYVLAPFSADEEETVEPRIADAAEAVLSVLRDGIAPTMNRYNAAPPAPVEATDADG
jgi:PTH1 family peptidyl-tRNA hydrolase